MSCDARAAAPRHCGRADGCGSRERLGSLPEIDVLAAPAKELLVQTADGEEALAVDGDASATTGILKNDFGRILQFQGSLLECTPGRSLAKIENKTLEVDYFISL